MLDLLPELIPVLKPILLLISNCNRHVIKYEYRMSNSEIQGVSKRRV